MHNERQVKIVVSQNVLPVFLLPSWSCRRWTSPHWVLTTLFFHTSQGMISFSMHNVDPLVGDLDPVLLVDVDTLLDCNQDPK